ncbi:MAG: restriction endonuclease [Phycisphaeraceae bacterium]|nr:restriction endonuclease [Phycisphaeraceae bacterium]
MTLSSRERLIAGDLSNAEHDSSVRSRLIAMARRVIWNHDRIAKEVAHAEQMLAEARRMYADLEVHKANFDRLVKEKTIAFPWLAHAIADYYALCEDRLARQLDTKQRPAPRAAEEIREASRRRREAERLLRLAEYKTRYYESLFPWLTELVDESVADDVVAATQPEASAEDPVSTWLTAAEYQKLTPSVRNQIALDRYKARTKSKWEIGRDYERFIGYCYERDGYHVSYKGAVDGFDDLGRDLIASKQGEVLIIQCKYWSQHKMIHEKHVFQVFGTAVEYDMSTGPVASRAADNRTAPLLFSQQSQIQPVLVVSNKCSDRARAFATRLGVVLREQVPLDSYPVIKCNVSSSRQRIYHLPFDQQYDRVVIELRKGECYADSVAEAESMGFRRAFRWKSGQE